MVWTTIKQVLPSFLFLGAVIVVCRAITFYRKARK